MSINATLFLQCVVFLALAWITMKFIWPPLIKAIEDRQKKIADGLAAADLGNESLKAAEVKIKQLEAEARHRAADIVAQTEKRAQALIEEAKAQAKAEGDRLVLAAKAEIEQEVHRAKSALREQVAHLAVTGAEQILRKQVDASEHAELLARLRTQL
jgi:F-type H+-transporting ATPase subunit b